MLRNYSKNSNKLLCLPFLIILIDDILRKHMMSEIRIIPSNVHITNALVHRAQEKREKGMMSDIYVNNNRI